MLVRDIHQEYTKQRRAFSDPADATGSEAANGLDAFTPASSQEYRDKIATRAAQIQLVDRASICAAPCGVRDAPIRVAG